MMIEMRSPDRRKLKVPVPIKGQSCTGTALWDLHFCQLLNIAYTVCGPSQHLPLNLAAQTDTYC